MRKRQVMLRQKSWTVTKLFFVEPRNEPHVIDCFFRTRSLYTVVLIGRRFRPSLNGSAPNSPPANSCPATRRQMKGRGRVKRNLSRSVVSNRCPTSSWSKSSRGPWRVTQSRTRSGHSTSLTMYRYGH